MFTKLAAPLTESDITKHWKYTDKVYVTSVCTTYNQEGYISDAIDSLLAQETEYRFEIIIHDDASTDSTTNIVKTYQEKYPTIIRAIIQTENQYSDYVCKPWYNCFRTAKGDYIALCEGDDFWIDKCKIQRQMESAVSNPQVNMLFSSAYTLSGTKVGKVIGKYLATDGLVSFREVIFRTQGQIPTASMFVAKKAADDFSEFCSLYRELTVGDIYLHFFASKDNGAYFYSKETSVYRIEASGSWTDTLTHSRWVMHLQAKRAAFVKLDEYTLNAYSNVLVKVCAKIAIDEICATRFFDVKSRELIKIYWKYFPLRYALYSVAHTFARKSRDSIVSLISRVGLKK